jgi:hypothetical protein
MFILITTQEILQYKFYNKITVIKCHKNNLKLD